MYKHILIPTDGSPTADKAVDAGIDFARQAGARITWFTAVPEYRLPSEGELVSRKFVSIAEHDRRSRETAEQVLDRPTSRAQAAGIDCDSDFVQSDHPYQAIIEAAERHGCDLILMASHGRHGLSALVYGSETRDVLTHSSIPTLVYR